MPRRCVASVTTLPVQRAACMESGWSAVGGRRLGIGAGMGISLVIGTRTRWELRDVRGILEMPADYPQTSRQQASLQHLKHEKK